jgi:hypothetical protein
MSLVGRPGLAKIVKRKEAFWRRRIMIPMLNIFMFSLKIECKKMIITMFIIKNSITE